MQFTHTPVTSLIQSPHRFLHSGHGWWSYCGGWWFHVISRNLQAPLRLSFDRHVRHVRHGADTGAAIELEMQDLSHGSEPKAQILVVQGLCSRHWPTSQVLKSSPNNLQYPQSKSTQKLPFCIPTPKDKHLFLHHVFLSSQIFQAKHSLPNLLFPLSPTKIAFWCHGISHGFSHGFPMGNPPSPIPSPPT